MGYENKMNLKMSRDKLLERGYCCGLECHNCPYDPPHKKGNKTVRSKINALGYGLYDYRRNRKII